MLKCKRFFWWVLILVALPFPLVADDRPRINNLQRPKIIIPRGTEPCNVPDRSCPLNFKCIVHHRKPGAYWAREWTCVYNFPLNCPPGFKGNVEYRIDPQRGRRLFYSCEMAVDPMDWCGKRWHVAPGYYMGAWGSDAQPEFSCMRNG